MSQQYRLHLKCLVMAFVDECFFWNQLTRVVPDKIHRAVKWLCVCNGLHDCLVQVICMISLLFVTSTIAQLAYGLLNHTSLCL